LLNRAAALLGAEAGDLTKERSTLRTAYAAVDRHVAAKTWIGGVEFSMADCAAAPALFFASTVQPFPDQLGSLKAYLDRLTDRPSFRRVLEEAKPYFSLYPFAEAVPGRFR
jgi:glutathione S-transferase